LQLLNNVILSMIAKLDSSFVREDEEGQTMIEYGLIVALISIVAILTLTTVGGNIQDVFNSIAGKLHS
jgi:pilus assembly protein Flp/PilA